MAEKTTSVVPPEKPLTAWEAAKKGIAESEERGRAYAPSAEAMREAAGVDAPPPPTPMIRDPMLLEIAEREKRRKTEAREKAAQPFRFYQTADHEADPIGVPSPPRAPGRTRQSTDYLKSESAPAGWNPEPHEISRLVDSGMLDRADAGNLERAWAAGRADVAKRGGHKWIDPAAGREIVSDLSRGESAVQKALWTQVPVTQLRGVPVINTYAMNKRAQDIWFSRLIKEKNVNLRTISPEERQELTDEAIRRAARTMTRVMQAGGRRLWADPLENDITDDIMESNFIWRMHRGLSSPVRYGAVGAGRGVNQKDDAVSRSRLVLTGRQLKYESPASIFGRYAPSTPLSAAISTGTLPWSRESIEAMRAGEDIVMHVHDVGQFIAQTEEGEDVPTAAKAAAAAGIIGIILMEPDPISFMTGKVGKVNKARKIATMNRRLAAITKRAPGVADALRTGAISTEQAVNQLASLDLAFAKAVELNAGARLRVGGTINASTDALQQRGLKLQAEAEALKQEAIELGAKYQPAEAAAQAEILKLDVLEREYAAAVIEALVTEAEKNALLMARGMSFEEADKITSRGKFPTDIKAARHAEKAAKQAQKELKELERAHTATLDSYWEAANDLGEHLRDLTTIAGELPGAKTARGKIRAEYDILARAGEQGKKTGQVPSIGQTVSVRRGKGFVRGQVDGIRILDSKGKPIGEDKPKVKKGEKGESYQIEVTVRTAQGEEKVIHPFTFDDWLLARDTQKRIDNFRRWHEEVYVVNPRGEDGKHIGTLAQRQAALNTIIADSNVLAKAYRDGGPGLKSLQIYQESMERLAAKEEAYKVAAKGAKPVIKTRDQIAKKWAKVSTKQAKKKLASIDALRAKKVYAEAVDEVSQGLETFRTRGLEQLGIQGIGSARKAWATQKAVGELPADRIKNWGMKVDDAQIEELYDPIRKELFSIDRTAGTASIESAELATTLETHMGKKAFKEWLSSASGTPLREVINEGAENAEKGLDTLVTRDLKKTAAVMESTRAGLGYGKASDLYAEDVNWGRAVFEAWEDLEIKDAKRGIHNLYMPTFTRWARRKKRSFENIPSRFGRIGEEMEQSFIGIERLFSRARLELSEVSRLESLGGNPVARFINFLDSTDPTEIDLKEGMSRWIEATGNGSAYQKAKMQILADTRADPMKQEDIANIAKGLRDNVQKKFDVLMRGDLILDGRKLDPKEIEELFDGMSDDLLYLYSTEGGFGGVPKALVSLSRMWLPSTPLKKIDSEEGIMLLGIARAALEKADTYADFSATMKRATYAVMKDASGMEAKAHSMGASAVMLAATLGEYSYRLNRSMFGNVDAAAAADINRIFDGAYNDVKDVNRATAVLNELGMPFGQGEIRTRVSAAQDELGKVSRSFIELGAKDGGSSMVPRALVRAIEDRVGDIAKSLDAQFIEARVGEDFAQAYTDYLNLWRGSAVTGLIVPNPRYWTNNIFGDFSQIWMEEGVAFAGRRSFINFPTNIPYFGRAMQLKGLYMAERVVGKSGSKDALPGMLETMLNPHLGQVFKGEAGTFVTKNGDVITYEQARKWALEDGISEAFVREELMEVMSRLGDEIKDKLEDPRPRGLWDTTKKKAVEFKDERQRLMADHASLVQERQRTGMYLDLIQRGVPRKEAARRTKNALYDWSHGIAEWEARSISRHLPFWRFWRLGMKQIADSLMEPMVRPSSEITKKALLGNTKLARLRQQLYIWPSLPEFIYQQDINAGITTNERVNLLAQQLYPDWQETRPKIGVLPIDPRRRQYYQEMYGRNYTHESILLPTVTAVDTFDMGLGLMAGLGVMVSKSAQMIPGLGDKLGLGDTTLVGDVEKRFFEPMLSMASPPLEAIGRPLIAGLGADLDYKSQGDYRYLSPTDEEILTQISKIPYFESIIEYDKTRGQWRVPTSWWMAYRGLPVASTQLSGWVSAVNNPEWDQGVFEGSTMMLRKLTRFGDPRPFDMNRTLQSRILEIENQWREFEQENKGIRESDRSIRTRGRKDD